MSDPLTILVTASGAPGSPRLLRALREADGRPVRLVGVDMRDESAGRFLCDRFRRVPPGSHPGYLEALLEVAEQERVDVVFPQSSAEVGAIAAGAERFGVPVLVSRPDAIERASAKSETVRLAERLGIPQPRTIAAADATGFRAAAAELGYPGRDVCMKPLEAKGSRGFRVLSAAADRREQLLGATAGHPAAAVPRGCRRDPGRRRGVPPDAGDGAGRGRGAGGGRALPERPHAGRKRQDA